MNSVTLNMSSSDFPRLRQHQNRHLLSHQSPHCNRRSRSPASPGIVYDLSATYEPCCYSPETDSSSQTHNNQLSFGSHQSTDYFSQQPPSLSTTEASNSSSNKNASHWTESNPDSCNNPNFQKSPKLRRAPCIHIYNPPTSLSKQKTKKKDNMSSLQHSTLSLSYSSHSSSPHDYRKLRLKSIVQKYHSSTKKSVWFRFLDFLFASFLVLFYVLFKYIMSFACLYHFGLFDFWRIVYLVDRILIVSYCDTSV